jgi:hypothetical protein
MDLNKAVYGGKESVLDFAHKMLGTAGQGGALPPEAVAHLKADKDPKARENFDKIFGPGAADRALGQ